MIRDNTISSAYSDINIIPNGSGINDVLAINFNSFLNTVEVGGGFTGYNGVIPLVESPHYPSKLD